MRRQPTAPIVWVALIVAASLRKRNHQQGRRRALPALDCSLACSASRSIPSGYSSLNVFGLNTRRLPSSQSPQESCEVPLYRIRLGSANTLNTTTTAS